MTPEDNSRQETTKHRFRGGETSPLLSRPQLAELIGKTTKTVNRWVDSGRLPEPHAWLGRSPAWIRQKVVFWLNAQDAQRSRWSA